MVSKLVFKASLSSNSIIGKLRVCETSLLPKVQWSINSSLRGSMNDNTIEKLEKMQANKMYTTCIHYLGLEKTFSYQISPHNLLLKNATLCASSCVSQPNG